MTIAKKIAQDLGDIPPDDAWLQAEIARLRKKNGYAFGAGWEIA